MIVHIHSINVLPCELSSYMSIVRIAVKHVIKTVKKTGRRSVLAVPIIGRRTQSMNDAIEEATKENITVVTPAGKK